MASTTAISIEEYLQTGYRPDREYIDGVLKEKPVAGFAHGEVQIILGEWFRKYRKEWNVRCSVETRTLVTSTRVRLPDFVVVSAPNSEQGALSQPPVITIEVLSPSDSYSDLRRRAEDLHTMGVRNIWLLDPAERTAEIWREGYWQPAGKERIDAVDPPIFLDLAWLWDELDG